MPLPVSVTILAATDSRRHVRIVALSNWFPIMSKLLSILCAFFGLLALVCGALLLLGGSLGGGFVIVVGAIFVICSVLIDLFNVKSDLAVASDERLHKKL
jgi:hypothetical protein